MENNPKRYKACGCQCWADAEGLMGSPTALWGAAFHIRMRSVSWKERVLARKPEWEQTSVCNPVTWACISSHLPTPPLESQFCQLHEVKYS